MSHPHAAEELDPIRVFVVGGEPERTEREAPDSSEWMTWQLTGTEKPFRVLPNNPKRDRAVIVVMPGNAANAAGYVMFGSNNKVSNGQGGILRSGASVTVEGASEVWCVPDGVNSLWVTVIDERYK